MSAVNVKGLDSATKSLREISQALASRAGIKEILAELGKEQTLQRFYDEKAPDGKPWQPLSLYTIKMKGHRRILIDKLTMIKSITSEVNKDGAFVYADDDYEKVATHQFGKGNVPKRPIFGISQQNEREIQAAVYEWLEGLG